MSNFEPITVGYWSIRGLAAPLRMMVMHAGAPLNNVMYDVKSVDGKFDVQEWFGVKPELKERNALINLPYVQDGKRLITQSNACFSYLGRKLGLWGRNEDDVIQCEEFLCELMDVRNDVVKFSYSKVDDCREKAAGFIAGLNGKLSKLELSLSRKEKNSTLFLVSNYPTAPDFHLYEMISQIKLACSVFNQPDCFAEQYPYLQFFYDNFRQLPQNSKYMESKLGTDIPINQKMAGFGASPDGAPWVHGQEYDFCSLRGSH